MDFYFLFGSILIVISIYVILHYLLVGESLIISEVFKRVQKLYTRNTYGYLNFLTKKELGVLKTFIKNNQKNLSVRANENELFGMIADLPDNPKTLIKKLRERIIKLEGIKKHYPDLIHEDTISYMSQGGYHDYHRDINYINWILVRYNIVISKPELGGLSVYGDEINDWPEGSIWKCVAGLVEHGVTKIESNDERIVLCLGFMIRHPDVMEKQHNPEIKVFENLPKHLDYMIPQ